MGKDTAKSRKERRKEARSAKQQHRLQSWVHHQAFKKRKREESMMSKSNKVAYLSGGNNSVLDKKIHECENNVKPNDKTSKNSRMKALAAKQSSAQIKEHLKTEKNGAVVSGNEDLALKMHLVELKVKEGGISGHDDDINNMLDGISVEKDSLDVTSCDKELILEHDQRIKYVGMGSILKMTEKKSKVKDKEPKHETKKKSKLKNKEQKHAKTHLEYQKKPKTKFEEYLKMEEHKTVSADEDLAMEQQLAKRLKVKNGKLGGSDDGLNCLIDGIFSQGDFVEEDLASQKKEKRKKKKTGELSDSKHKLTKLLEGPTSCLKKKQGFLGCSESSEMSMEVDCVFQDANDKHIEFEESEACVEDGQLYVSETFRTKKLRNDSSVSEGGGTNTKPDQQQSTENSLVKYVAPHLRLNFVNATDESVQTRRHVRGLLNRLSECNVESVAAEVSTVFQLHGRSLAAQIVGDEVLASCSKGPRGNEQYAAVFAAFASGIAASVGMDFGAKLLASLATSFEEEHRKEDGLALRNITLLLSYLYIFGLCSSDIIYDLLDLLSKRLEELDVSTILTILQCCGMCLRTNDPAAMKDFIVGVQQHVHALKALPSGTQDGKPKINGKRMEFMLETICEIKNNKKRPKEESPPHTRLKKWLQKLRVEDVQLRGIKWNKLLDPNKKGQWWLSGDIERTGKDPTIEIADVIDTEVAEAQKMLHLASSQRMNTEARRAIFCIIMSGEDYLDAFEKILRLALPGKQDREILRVLVECCLQEKAFNKYYSLLAAKLCHHDKNHKFSLQYCIWDHFKQLDSMELRRLANLARFVADLIGSFSLSISVLKAVDFTDCALLTSKVVMHFRILFETLLTEYSDSVIWNIFTRIANYPELENFRNGLELFMHQHVNKNALTGEQLGPPESVSLIVSKCKVAKKALTNVAGILL